jgi:crotonobetainyl-CoA:carnitine CoA-transferase CaiB-like acyl-CoA transferase
MFEHAPALMGILEDAFLAAPARDWVARLNAIGMLAAPVQDHAEVAVDAQVQANSYIQPVERPGAAPVPMVSIGMTIDDEPVPIPHLAPQHGEHTEEILLEFGYSWDEIAELRSEKIIGPTPGA